MKTCLYNMEVEKYPDIAKLLEPFGSDPEIERIIVSYRLLPERFLYPIGKKDGNRILVLRGGGDAYYDFDNVEKIDVGDPNNCVDPSVFTVDTPLMLAAAFNTQIFLHVKDITKPVRYKDIFYRNELRRDLAYHPPTAEGVKYFSQSLFIV